MPRRAPSVPIATALLLLAACNEQVVVEQDTVVYEDGSVYRRVELTGRDEDGETPDEPGWLANSAGVSLAEPGLWRIQEERPDGFVVEAVFDRAESVPPSLAHETDEGRVTDRAQVSLGVQDLLVLTRRSYEETIGDPFGPSSLEAALDALTELAVESLREEVRLEFGGRVNPKRAESFLRGDARELAGELMGILRQHPWGGPEATVERTRLLDQALGRRDIPAPADLAAAADWGEALGVLLDPVLHWSRERVAAALASGKHPVTADDLSFWPTAEQLGEIVATTTDEPEPERVTEFRRSTESLLRAVQGLYSDPAATRFRLESWVELPGRLLTTNGTPGEGGVLWVLDNAALARGASLRAVSVEPNADVLADLGARRELDDVALLRLADLLTDPDRGERLRELLGRAVDRRSLDPLADEDLDVDLVADARELLEWLAP